MTIFHLRLKRSNFGAVYGFYFSLLFHRFLLRDAKPTAYKWFHILLNDRCSAAGCQAGQPGLRRQKVVVHVSPELVTPSNIVQRRSEPFVRHHEATAAASGSRGHWRVVKATQGKTAEVRGSGRRPHSDR